MLRLERYYISYVFKKNRAFKNFINKPSEATLKGLLKLELESNPTIT
jgi:hypothetical protein